MEQGFLNSILLYFNILLVLKNYTLETKSGNLCVDILAYFRAFFFFFQKKDNFFCARCLTKTKQLLVSASVYYDIYSTVRVGEGGCEFDLLLHCVGIIDLGRQFMGQSASCTVVKWVLGRKWKSTQKISGALPTRKKGLQIFRLRQLFFRCGGTENR